MENGYLNAERARARRTARQSIAAVAGSLLVAFALVAGAKAFYPEIKSAVSTGSDAALPVLASDVKPVVYNDPQSLSAAFSNVAKAVGPAVVHINVVQNADPSERQMFGFGFGGPQGGERERGTGSGVIVNPNGYILTNNHVVGKATSIEVKLSDGQRRKGTVVGTDAQTDLAVVKIDGANLPTAPLGNSDAVTQGDWVVALGSPFGLEQTITAGIVSATGRRISGSPYDAFIQTDASINPGNSGGPLVNLKGEVVGINTLIYSRTGGNQGIGFAIPSNLARHVYDQLSSGEHRVIRGYLGVTVNDVEPTLAEALGADPSTKGAVIEDLADNASPAAKAGLQAGDIVTELNGKPIASAQDLTMAVADVAPGTSVQVGYLRNGAPSSVTVTVVERPSNPGLAANESDQPDEQSATPSRQKLGVGIDDVSPEIAQQLRLKIADGAVIVAVDPNGVAAEAGLQRGDVVHRFGKNEIKSAADLTSAVAAQPTGGKVVLQIERQGRLAFVTVDLG